MIRKITELEKKLNKFENAHESEIANETVAQEYSVYHEEMIEQLAKLKEALENIESLEVLMKPLECKLYT
jgi:esterase/lipase